MILRLAVLVEHRLVTDRQTDRHTMTASTALWHSVARVKRFGRLCVISNLFPSLHEIQAVMRGISIGESVSSALVAQPDYAGYSRSDAFPAAYITAGRTGGRTLPGELSCSLVLASAQLFMWPSSVRFIPTPRCGIATHGVS